MESMRQLGTSLPRRRNDEPLDLLSDFRTAARSVTNLYKTAASAQGKARAAGYQDALDDVLAFLDKENMGLMDGEGWRVRQWATARLEDAAGGVPEQKQQAGSDDDEVAEREEEAAGTRSSSPEVQRKPPTLPTPSSELAEQAPSHREALAEPPAIQSPPPEAHPPQPTAAVSASAPVPSLNDFTFRSNHHQAYPTNHDREPATMDLDTASTPPSSTEPIRIIPRPSRNRHNTNHNHNRQQRERERGGNGGAAAINFNLGAGAGSKRKIPYPDFFDISGINNNNLDGQDRRDGGGGGKGGGGKRGRHV
ncbi:hypothetical protein LTR36_009257 [Oleoguttula mirabilis]|uniref:Uncharacterized protein n=1 Tax=Oleoguttula mirabilis TaxID=1507867 RepID=A0AAV9J7M9_9PEZI|nr:hypothetical protein LTR36_009257 [Oleoguttula mirabilis]